MAFWHSAHSDKCFFSFLFYIIYPYFTAGKWTVVWNSHATCETTENDLIHIFRLTVMARFVTTNWKRTIWYPSFQISPRLTYSTPNTTRWRHIRPRFFQHVLFSDLTNESTFVQRIIFQLLSPSWSMINNFDSTVKTSFSRNDEPRFSSTLVKHLSFHSPRDF
jgi:hypothetical protein